MIDRASNPVVVGVQETEVQPLSPPSSGSRTWYTPPQLAAERHLRVHTVLGWIRSGELEAINHASNRLGPPRWKISADALARFDAARSSRVTATRSATRPRPGKGVVVKEFFE